MCFGWHTFCSEVDRSARRISVLLLMVGCSGVHGPVAECEVPPSECAVGLFFGDCGGARAPVLACGFDGRCRWYTGGCPVGHTASSCPPGNPCCHETADGPWPYADGWRPDRGASSPLYHQQMVFDLEAMGNDAVTPSSPALSVVIDPSLERQPALRWECTEGNPVELCAMGSVHARGGGDGVWATVELTTDSASGERLWLELLADEAGEIVARAFLWRETDHVGTSPPTRCPELRPAFASGSLRLQARDLAWTAPPPLRLELAQPDGHRLVLQL